MSTKAALDQDGPVPAPFMEPRLTRPEMVVAGILFVILLGLRLCYIRSRSWNSDETQHLHVIWGWVHGQLPYVRFFDNHTPLFHLLVAPIFALCGERPDIVEPMRLLMLPLFGLSLWCIFGIGKALFSARTGLWAALVAGFDPDWSLKMVEFRTDVLWATLWLVILLILVSGRLTPQRLFWAGVTMGAAFGVSMKTTLLLLTLITATTLTALACWRWRIAGLLRPTVPQAACAIAGLFVIPVSLIAFFAANSALTPLYDCVIRHNTLPGDSHEIFRRLGGWRLLYFTYAAGLLGFACFRPWREAGLGARRLFFLLNAALFYPLLRIFWPVITPQDFVPWQPTLRIAVVVLIVVVTDWLSGRLRSKFLPLAVLLLVSGYQLRLLLASETLTARPNAGRIAMIADALRLTRPGEKVMDAKGELIFRERCYYYVLETLTLRRVELGLLADDLPATLVREHPGVLTGTWRTTPATKAFVAANYISVGTLEVPGKILDTASAAGGRQSFEVVIPAEYTFSSESGETAGLLDGQPWVSGHGVPTGRHTFERSSGRGRVALLWARAAELGYSPFRKMQ